jgi:NADH-quinone oxidoreductase subunit L
VLALLWLVPLLPLVSFVVLALFGPRLTRRAVALLGAGSIGVTMILSIAIGLSFLSAPPPDQAYSQTLWTWLQVGNFAPGIAFYLDPVSLVMMIVVTFVGFLIHLYSIEAMREEEGYSRFFAYMNLFMGAMLTLVLADNLLLLYLGWEGVGLCSYLLIGFWYKDPANGRAARKAFVVTRVGDAALTIGLFLIFSQLGTLNIQAALQRAVQQWPISSTLAVAATILLVGGAVGKSAQLPLQVWLPDAMAGPTPASALIHAATMVTAGVYLIARTNVLFSLAPSVMLLVAIIGALTLLLAGFSALVQRDIKRVLAYSTISQVGYMFLALGVGAWSAALFHFMTHAFFKALLFLGAGVVIVALHEEHDMFKMGGLRKQLPVAFWTFLIGAASLSALPLITAGFYSKDLILWNTLSSPAGGVWLWIAGLIGAVLTALYAFRMVFLTFFGIAKVQVRRTLGFCRAAPLIILASLSIVSGFIERPLIDFLDTVLPPTGTVLSTSAEILSQLIASALAVSGIALAYWLVLRRPQITASWVRTRWGAALQRFWFVGWGFDELYDRLFVRPYCWLARVAQGDVIDQIYLGIARLNRALHHILSRTQNGQVRRYAAGIAIGAVIILALVVFR